MWNKSVDSSASGFQINNGNTIACTIQRAGSAPVIVQPTQWSPRFTENGRYDIFVAGSLVQFTVHYEGGGVNIVPGQGGGTYVVWTTLV